MHIGYLSPNGIILNKDWTSVILMEDNHGNVLLKQIFDSNGKIKMGKQEHMIHSYQNINLFIQDNWKRHGYTELWEGHIGSGPVLVTNRKIIHYREPGAGKYLEYETATLSLPGAIGKALSAKNAKERGLMEYCEIPYYGISKIECFHKVQLMFEGQPLSNAYIDIIYDDRMFRVVTTTHITNNIIPSLQHKEVSREVIGKKGWERTAIWYVNPEDVDEKKLSNCRKYKLKARKALKKGNITKAIDHLEKAAEFRPNDPETLDELCSVLFDNKEYQKYLTYIDRCLNMNHSLREAIPSYLFNKGNALFNMKKYNEALDQYQKYIDEDPESHSINGLYGKAKTYLALDSKDDAENNIQKALELMPDHPDLIRLKKEIDKHV